MSNISSVVAPPTSLLRRVTHSVSWLAVAQIGRRIWSLVITAVLARLLSPGDFGLLALTSLVLGVISMFAETGLTSAIIQRAEVDEEHLSSAFWLNMVVCMLLAFIGAALAYPLARLYHEPRIAPLIMAMMLTLPLNSLGQVSGALLQKRLAFQPLAIIDIVSALASGLAAMLLAFQGVEVWALVAQYIVLAATSALGRVVVAKWNPKRLFNRACVHDMMGFSLSVFGCSIVNYIVRNIDNALIGGTLGAVPLGFYSMAYNLVLMPGTTIGGLVGQVMFPVLSSIQNDVPRLRGAYLRTLRVVSLVSFPFAVGLGASAPLFVLSVYGLKWQPVIPLLQILSVIGLLESINICGVIFFALNRANIMLAWAVVSLVVMTLSFAVSVRWGAIGVVWAYVLVSPIVSVGPHLLANRLLSLRLFSWLQSLGPAFFAALIMGVLVRIALIYAPLPFARPGLNLVCLTLFGAMVYLAALYIMGSLFRRSQDLVPWLRGDELA